MPPASPDIQKATRNTGAATDGVTEVRREEALLKAGALQSAIFNSANFSSIATDEKGVIQIFNVGAERMLGYAAADVVNKVTPAEISDPLEVVARAKALSLELGSTIAPGFEALVFKASRGIEDIYELTYIRKDGSRFPAIVSVTALRGDDGGIIGYLLIGTDNSARKRAEQALLKAGALQSAIFNSANFSSIATDEKGVIQIFNVGAERMLGYAAADVMNKVTPAEISDPLEVVARAKALSLELGSTIAPGFEALVFKASRGIEDIYELTYIRKDGSRLPAIVSVTALRGDDNAIIGYLLIGTDNTARKQIEEDRKKLDQRLRDQQFYTRSLIESSIDALITTDPLGIITDVNKQMEALTGCTRDELIGAPFKNYFTDPERAEAAIMLVLNEKKIANHELTARARDGKETVVSYNATTFYDRDRRLQGVFASARDITERKRFEHALQESNSQLENAKFIAEKANLAKSDFLSSMSHELRSPLNAILGFAQLMESSSPPPTESQAARISQILKAGWHLLKLINEVLDLSVIESGQVSLSKESVSLSEVMAECQTMMGPEAQKRDISMVFPRFENPVFVKADMTRLKQILINLISNAIKYNREHGSVLVECTVSAPERIRISVRDTGYGLSPEKLAQLFQPFNRLGQEEGSIAGTGIGLVVTKRLAELMDGVLGVESKKGVGSVFWCDLASTAAPQLRAHSEVSGITPRLKPPQGSPVRTLLYVEDNPANMELVAQLIERCPDLRLLTAVNGSLGVELARSARPQIILMDINLPGMSGIDALRLLRRDPATAHIPIVALSANAMPRDIAKGMKEGFFRYLTKPIKVKDFMDTLAAALEFTERPAAKEENARGLP
jgi:PAS domain S-box-containing protein